jgi:hypothetical protein
MRRWWLGLLFLSFFGCGDGTGHICMRCREACAPNPVQLCHAGGLGHDDACMCFLPHRDGGL